MKLPKELTTVTRVSKALALLVLIVLPICGFFYGMYYQRLIDASDYHIAMEYAVGSRIPTPTPLPTKDSMTSCSSNRECPVGDTCVVQGPIVYGKKQVRTCLAPGHAAPL